MAGVQFPKTGDHVFVVEHDGDVLEGVVKAYSGAYNKNGSIRKQFNTRLLAKVEITAVVMNESGRASRKIGDTLTVGLDTIIVKKAAGDKYNASMKTTSLNQYRKALRASSGTAAATGPAVAGAGAGKTRRARRKNRKNTLRKH